MIGFQSLLVSMIYKSLLALYNQIIHQKIYYSNKNKKEVTVFFIFTTNDIVAVWREKNIIINTNYGLVRFNKIGNYTLE